MLRTDAFRRLAPEQIANLTTKEQERQEIDEQVREFLARGGRIETLPVRTGDPTPQAPSRPSRGSVVDLKADLAKGVLLIDGEEWVSLDRAAAISGWSKPVLNKHMREGTFPQVRKVSRRNFTRHVDALRWTVENGKRQCDKDSALLALEAMA